MPTFLSLQEIASMKPETAPQDRNFRIEHKNMRGICPLDLAPELRKLQQTCVEELFKNACTGESEQSSKTTSGPVFRHWNRLQVDNGTSLDH